MNFNKLMKQAQEVQKKMQDMQDKFASEEYTGKSGGGLVTATITGDGRAKSAFIDASLFRADEKETVEDLIVTAFNNAKLEADSNLGNKMSDLTSGLGLPPGFKLPI